MCRLVSDWLTIAQDHTSNPQGKKKKNRLQKRIYTKKY